MKRPLPGVVVLLALAAAACDPSALDNNAPEASAGADVEAFVGESVTLDASGSTDADADPLTYAWTITTQPDTSTATLSNATTVSPGFTADVPGTYVFQVTVSDADESDTDEVTLTASWDLRLSGTINSDTTLADRGAPYTVASGLAVGATLTLAPGVVIEFAQNTRLTVNSGGVLIAEGTAADTIRLVGSAETAGHWQGVEISSSSADNLLSYVEIAHAGGGGWAGVWVHSGARVAIENSLIRNSATVGVEVGTTGNLTGWSANTLQDNAAAGVRISGDGVRYLDAASSYAGGATEWAVDLVSGTASTAGTWPALDAPYLVTGGPSLSTAITVAPGAVFMFEQGERLIVNSGGSLNAVGTAEDSIRFLGTEDVPGHWEGIEVASTSASNALERVEIAHAGAAGWAGLWVHAGASMDVSSSLIRDNANVGVKNANGNMSGWSANELRDNETAGVELNADYIRYLDGPSTYAGGATQYGIRVLGGTVSTAATWPKIDSPYLFENGPSLSADVTVGPGATLLFTQSERLIINSGGSLTAQGTAADTITIAGVESIAGFWQGIEVSSLDAGNAFDYVVLGHGGAGGWANIWVHSGAGITVSNSILHDSSECAVVVSGTGSYTATNVTYTGNAGGDVCTP